VRVVTDVRVLMITIGYPPDEIGGTEVYVSGLVDALEAHRCTAEVAYVSEAPSGDDIAVRSEVRGRPSIALSCRGPDSGSRRSSSTRR
jgi:hypothetical protein